MKYFILIIVTSTVVFSQGIWGDNSRDNEREWKPSNQHNTVSSPTLYEKECGSCHMAYPVAALPQRSWAKIMAALDDHFGDNAELDAETHKAITEYLDSHSTKASKRLRKLHKGVRDNSTPMRITELPYFKHEHDEIPARLVKANPKVGSFSQCDRCHQDAQSNRFDEHKVNIPGYGRWDD